MHCEDTVLTWRWGYLVQGVEVLFPPGGHMFSTKYVNQYVGRFEPDRYSPLVKVSVSSQNSFFD